MFRIKMWTRLWIALPPLGHVLGAVLRNRELVRRRRNLFVYFFFIYFYTLFTFSCLFTFGVDIAEADAAAPSSPTAAAAAERRDFLGVVKVDCGSGTFSP